MRAAAKREAEDDATDMKDFGDTPKKVAKLVPDKKLLNDFQMALIERRAKLDSLKVSFLENLALHELSMGHLYEAGKVAATGESRRRGRLVTPPMRIQ